MLAYKQHLTKRWHLFMAFEFIAQIVGHCAFGEYFNDQFRILHLDRRQPTAGQAQIISFTTYYAHVSIERIAGSGNVNFNVATENLNSLVIIE